MACLNIPLPCWLSGDESELITRLMLDHLLCTAGLISRLFPVSHLFILCRCLFVFTAQIASVLLSISFFVLFELFTSTKRLRSSSFYSNLANMFPICFLPPLLKSCTVSFPFQVLELAGQVLSWLSIACWTG